MSDDAKKVIKFLAEVAVTVLILWYSTPGRQPLTPYLWRAGARSAARAAYYCESVAVWCRSHYWKAVRP